MDIFCVRRLMDRLRFFLRDCEIHGTIRKMFPGTLLEPGVVVKGDLKNLRLGKNVNIQSGTVLHLGGFEWCGNEGRLEIGDDCALAPNCVVFGAGPGGVRIGNRFDCGSGVGIFSSRTDYLLGPHTHVFKPVVIGDDVIVFSNAVIGPGVTIGDGAVVAGGSVVTRDVPAGCFVGGAPAKILRRNLRPPSVRRLEAPRKFAVGSVP